MPIKNFVIGQRVSPEKRERAKQLRRDATPAENRLWQRLRGNRLNGLHFRRQHVIAGYIVDFYCHARALIIEVDGPIHASRVEEDAQREQHLRRHGFRIIRFSNEEVLDHTEMVIAAIREACEEPNPPAPFPKRDAELLAQINAAYDEAPDAEDTAALEMMRVQRRELGEDEAWQ